MNRARSRPLSCPLMHFEAAISVNSSIGATLRAQHYQPFRSSIRFPILRTLHRSPATSFLSNRILPAARSLLAYFPRAQNDLPDPISGINLRNPGTNSIDDNQYFLKVDHSFNNNNKVFARYATNIPKCFSITNNPEFSYLVEAQKQQSRDSVAAPVLTHGHQ